MPGTSYTCTECLVSFDGDQPTAAQADEAGGLDQFSTPCPECGEEAVISPDEPRDQMVRVRVSAVELDRAKRAALAQRQNLSEWIREALRLQALADAP